MEHVWGLNSLPVLLTNPSTYFEKPFKAADPAALLFLLRSARNHGIRPDEKSYSLLFFISSTTAGSSNVVVSPRFSVSPSAIFLKILRMIFPLLVFGNPVTN